MAGQQSARATGRESGVRRARGSLNEDEILEGARELIEKEGLEQLSMPALARNLGSGVTSIYWYFRSKDDLLSALAERVATEMYARLPPVGDREWSVELEQYFVSVREEAKRSPVYLELFERRARFLFSRPPVADAVVPHLEDILSVLVRAGLSVEDASHVYAACSVYTRGFVQLEHGLDSEEADPDVYTQLDKYVAGLDAGTYPTLTKFSSFQRAMALDDEEFRFGLRLKIAGVRAILNTEE
jgi:AcrR family transcriptional regulator